MITEDPLKMDYRTYHKFFRASSAYAFRRPLTDVYDFCSKCEVLLKVNPDHPCKTKHTLHIMKFNKYKTVKEDILKKAKDDDFVLVLEFDHAQNRPLPKLNINSQFYKIFLWLYIFYVHCHNDDSSTLYWYLENEGNKNSNTVCSLLYDYISRKMRDSVKTVVFFSDVGGVGGKIKVCLLSDLWHG